MADVFVSYHMKSAGEVVRRIVETLELDGISCWYAGRDMEIGSFPGIAKRAIDRCRVFLLILNQYSVHSEHVKNEVALAFKRYARHEPIDFLIFSVDGSRLEDDDDMEYILVRQKVLGGCPPDETRVQTLVEQVKRIAEPSGIQQR